MKIVLYDPYLYKFTQGMVDWWLAQGHEVKVDRYYDPRLVDWADLIWFDTCDNNLKAAMNPGEALLAEWLKDGISPVDMHDMDLTGKKVVVRPIDIEVWGGGHADAKCWDLVNHCIFIAPHIRDLMMADSRPQESNMSIDVIPCAVDLSKYTFKERGPGFEIAVISEIWESKGIDYTLQIALKLKQIDPRYKISYLGKWQDYHWHRAYVEEFVKRNELNIEFIDYVDSIDQFLEDKNYLLHSSIKEAFSYATAEAMAKGIKPVLHHFYGAGALWPGITWDGIDEAVQLIAEPRYDSESYRQYLIDRGYTIDQMMEKIMAVVGG